MDETYDKVNEAWKKTCRVLLGDEIGELKEFEDYLSRYTGGKNLWINKSAISGKNVDRLISKEFCKGAKFIRYDEQEEYNELMLKEKIDINKIKDLDSIVENLSEKLYYTGSVVLGNSKNIIDSNQIVNSFFIYKSGVIIDSKYMAYCLNVRRGEYMFGSWGTAVKFGINCQIDQFCNRCMATISSTNCSDCYFTSNVENCNNLMFSFNQRNKHDMIGNRELPKEKYLKLKEKLVGDIKETLKAKKTLPSVLELGDVK
ncbi:hypothetical protein KO465_03015 [Candidatus Micrarchaeota archaeon]|nr:hypothetical protein [Candidatus Micrarchaeota archaeon]